MASFTVLALMDLVRGAGPPPSPLSSPNRYVNQALESLISHVRPEPTPGSSSSSTLQRWDLFAWLKEAGGSAESTVCGRVFKDVSSSFIEGDALVVFIIDVP